MSDRPAKPLDDMDYLDGYLDYVFNDDDMSDGAWFASCVSTIAEHWDMDYDDAHEVFLSYMSWKATQPGSNVTMTPSEAEQRD